MPDASTSTVAPAPAAGRSAAAAQRLRVGQFLLASVLMGAHVVFVISIGTWTAVPAVPLWTWAAVTVATYVAFYVALRSGWSERLRDPSMTQHQVVASLVFAGVSYLFLGPVRGLLPGAMLVVVCFGMFKLRVRTVLGVALLGWLVLAAAVGLHLALAPPPVDPTLDLAHLFAAFVMFMAVGLLAGRLSRIRARLTAQREQLNEALARIEALAHRDALTGLFNRRFADEVLLQAVQRQRRQPHPPLCVAIVDLDHFKRVNDRHGHAVGDAVLCAFAKVGLATLRNTDTLARWGGEEFLLILQASDLMAAELALERLRTAVAAQPLALDGGDTLPYPFSAGLTAWRPGDALAHLLERADRALYQAKAEGRNRVVTL